MLRTRHKTIAEPKLRVAFCTPYQRRGGELSCVGLPLQTYWGLAGDIQCTTFVNINRTETQQNLIKLNKSPDDTSPMLDLLGNADAQDSTAPLQKSLSPLTL